MQGSEAAAAETGASRNSSVDQAGGVAPRSEAGRNANAADDFSTISGSSIERMSLQQLLLSITSRLQAIERTLSPRDSNAPTARSRVLEGLQLIFGHWPAFAFLFLALFYVPLRDVLVAIPDKVRSASEIGLPGGLTLKGTIAKAAAEQGQGRLAAVIPGLSSDAIELLMRAPRNEESLISYTPSTDNSQFLAISFPSPKTARAIAELEEKRLVKLEGDIGGVSRNPMSGQEFETGLDDIRHRFPGSEEPSSDKDRVRVELREPRDRASTRLPIIQWELTETGTNAADLILSTVAAELSQVDAPSQ